MSVCVVGESYSFYITSKVTLGVKTSCLTVEGGGRLHGRFRLAETGRNFSYSMGQNSDTWPQLIAKKTGKQDSYMFRRKGKQIW